MKKTILLLLFILSVFVTKSQNNTAAFLSFKGDGYYKRVTKKEKLSSPMFFKSGDKIELTKGNATLLISNGSEVNLRVGTEFKIPQLKKNEMLVSFDASLFQDYMVQSQSNSSITIRGDSVALNLYPISSKIILSKNNKILWFTNSEKLNFKFVIYDANTLDEVFVKDNFSESEIELKSLGLSLGLDYTWILAIKGTNTEQLGFISILSASEILKQPKFELKTKIDYIKAYTYYEKNEFYFEAYNVIEKANFKYPKIDLFKLMMNKMNGNE